MKSALVVCSFLVLALFSSCTETEINETIMMEVQSQDYQLSIQDMSVEENVNLPGQEDAYTHMEENDSAAYWYKHSFYQMATSLLKTKPQWMDIGENQKLSDYNLNITWKSTKPGINRDSIVLAKLLDYYGLLLEKEYKAMKGYEMNISDPEKLNAFQGQYPGNGYMKMDKNKEEMVLESIDLEMFTILLGRMTSEDIRVGSLNSEVYDINLKIPAKFENMNVVLAPFGLALTEKQFEELFYSFHKK